MLRKNGSAPSCCQNVNGYTPEKGASRTQFSQVNGYAPEKKRFLSDFIHFYVLLWTNGHQKEPILALLAADCSPGILNGYAPEYVAFLLCSTISEQFYVIVHRIAGHKLEYLKRIYVPLASQSYKCQYLYSITT